MINLFTPSVNDQSLTYLYFVFGSMNGVIPGGSSVDITLLGTMFKTFNSVILAVGALIVVYVTVVGVMNTAHEGKFMGKDWNNLWIPIRVVLGIGALIPTASGYSGIQILMMWVILQGIGAADTLWATALTFISQTGSASAKVVPPASGAAAGLKDLFTGVLCNKTATRKDLSNIYPKTGIDNSYYCNPVNGNNFCSSPVARSGFTPTLGDGIPYRMGPDGTCGTLTTCDEAKHCTASASDPSVGPDSLACLSCQAQIKTLPTILEGFGNIADRYIEVDYAYTKYWFETAEGAIPTSGAPKTIPDFVAKYCTDKGITKADCTGAGSLPSPLGDGMSAPGESVIDAIYWPYGMEMNKDDNFMRLAVAEYSSGVDAAIATFFTGQADNPNSQLRGMLQRAMDQGWILAGSYYLMLSRSSSSNLNAAMPTIKYDISSENIPTTPDSPLYKYRNNYRAAERLVALSGGGGGATGDARMAPAGAAMGSAANDAGAAMGGAITDNESDPLVKLSQAGYILIAVATALVIVIFAILMVAGAVGNLNFQIFGSGMTENPFGSALSEVLLILLPIFFLFLGVMFSVGATLAIYIPLIPYTIFTIGAIGWMLSAVEAMVAGPLVALGILSPSGNHEMLGKAEPALMLLFNIFLRPSLMIFGMMAAILLSTVVLKMINTGFATVFLTLFDFSNSALQGQGAAHSNSVNSGAMNPVAMVFVLVFYVTLITTALNKTFGAIHIIPEKVMRWIGGQGDQYGEAEALGEVKGAVAGAGQKAGEGAQATLGTAKARMDISKSAKGRRSDQGAEVGDNTKKK